MSVASPGLPHAGARVSPEVLPLSTPTHDGSRPRSPTLQVVLRYLAFQIPGWIVVTGLLAAAVEWWELSVTVAAVLLGLFVLKDAVLFPFVRIAYEPRSGGGAQDLLGKRAVALDTLRPMGYVRVGGELWHAELQTGELAPPGTRLRVVAVRGLTLLVEKEPSP